MPAESGLGPQLAGEKITVNSRTVQVVKQLGEGGFSFVYLVKDESGGASQSGGTSQSTHSGRSSDASQPNYLVLKITSIHSRNQRDIAEKEAKLLSRLSHPSIVRMIDTCYRSTPPPSGRRDDGQGVQPRPQHLILMEYCEGGTALSACTALRQANQRFDLPSLIIAFGQICNAVSYLHAQRPPIVHRDLKPVNFLVKNGAYKLCDFGSAVFGHVDLRTPAARAEAEEVVQKTTTQMFRAPEMVDLYMTKKLTQATDVWALGCCLYSLAFFQNCFEEGSNLAILSRNYKIPEDNPYGDGLVELIDRMLTVDVKARADMTEVILCLSAIYSGRPLPPRKRPTKKKETDENEGASKVGAFRTDGQGIRQNVVEQKKPAEAKKLDPNSAAARRKRAVKQTTEAELERAPIGDKKFETSFSGAFGAKQSEGSSDPFGQAIEGKVYDPLSFSNLGGSSDNDQAAAFPAFAETNMPSSGGGFPLDDSFDANKVSFSSFDKTHSRQDSNSSDLFDETTNLSDSLTKQANITNAKDRPEKGKKNGGVKGLFKIGGK